MMEMEVFRLADLATSFATRMKAREVAELLSNRVQNTKGDAVVVDWNGVNAVSPSFIDEFIGEIGVIMQNQSRGRSIVFAGDDSYIIELIDTILRRREYPLGYALRPDDVREGQLGVLGDPTRSRVVPA